jgi:hypothetical protein
VEPQMRGMEKLTEGPVGLGTRYRATLEGQPVRRAETVAFDRPRSRAMHKAARSRLGSRVASSQCRREPVCMRPSSQRHMAGTG